MIRMTLLPLKAAALLLLLAVACLGTITNVSVTGTTATQAIVTYTAPDANACTIQVSQNSSLSPLIPDVDPTIFSAANNDLARPSTLTYGLSRTVVIGQRTAQLATASGANTARHYSRALQAATPHFGLISCASTGDTAPFSFITTTIMPGNTYGEPWFGDPANPGQTPFPVSDHGATFQAEWNDPSTGSLVEEISTRSTISNILGHLSGTSGNPGNGLITAHNGGVLNNPCDSVGPWTSPCNAICVANQGTYFTCPNNNGSSTPSSWATVGNSTGWLVFPIDPYQFYCSPFTSPGQTCQQGGFYGGTRYDAGLGDTLDQIQVGGNAFVNSSNNILDVCLGNGYVCFTPIQQVSVANGSSCGNACAWNTMGGTSNRAIAFGNVGTDEWLLDSSPRINRQELQAHLGGAYVTGQANCPGASCTKTLTWEADTGNSGWPNSYSTSYLVGQGWFPDPFSTYWFQPTGGNNSTIWLSANNATYASQFCPGLSTACTPYTAVYSPTEYQLSSQIGGNNIVVADPSNSITYTSTNCGSGTYTGCQIYYWAVHPISAMIRRHTADSSTLSLNGVYISAISHSNISTPDGGFWTAFYNTPTKVPAGYFGYFGGFFWLNTATGVSAWFNTPQIVNDGAGHPAWTATQACAPGTFDQQSGNAAPTWDCLGTDTITTTGTASNASTTLTVANGQGVTIGERVSGTGIPSSGCPTVQTCTTVTAVSGTTVTLSNATTQALSGTTVTFTGQVVIQGVYYGPTTAPTQAYLSQINGYTYSGSGSDTGVCAASASCTVYYGASNSCSGPAVTGGNACLAYTNLTPSYSGQNVTAQLAAYSVANSYSPTFNGAYPYANCTGAGFVVQEGAVLGVCYKVQDTLGWKWALVLGDRNPAHAGGAGVSVLGMITPGSITVHSVVDIGEAGSPGDPWFRADAGTHYYWRPKVDPTGASLTAENASWSTDHQYDRDGNAMAANNAGALACPGTSPYFMSEQQRLGSVPSITSATIYTTSVNTAFAGSCFGLALPNDLQSHPNPGGANVASTFGYDYFPQVYGGQSIGGQGYANTANAAWTNVAGTLYTYTPPTICPSGCTMTQCPTGFTCDVDDPVIPAVHPIGQGNLWGQINFKLTGTALSCGAHPLVDISGPSSSIGTTAAYNYEFCRARANGECYPGSSAGQMFVNCPNLITPGIQDGNISGLPANYFSRVPVNAAVGGYPMGMGNDILVYNASMHSNKVSQFNLNIAGDGVTGQNDPTAADGRPLALCGPVRMCGGQQDARVTPDGSWIIYPMNAAFNGQDMYAAKIPAWPAQISLSGSGFVPVTVGLPPVPGAASAVVEFGYQEDGAPASLYCTSRQDTCMANHATIPAGTQPFQYASESPAGLACASGCVISVPAIPWRILYYRAKYLDGSNNVVATTGDLAVAVD
jgi:hypothetical protein